MGEPVNNLRRLAKINLKNCFRRCALEDKEHDRPGIAEMTSNIMGIDEKD